MNNKKSILILYPVLLFLLAGICEVLYAGSHKVALLKDTSVILPAKTKITINWLSKPVSTKENRPAWEKGMKFSVSPGEELWVSREKLLLNSYRGFAYGMDKLFKDFLFLDNNAFFMTTDSYLGSLAVPDKKEFKLVNGVGPVKFQALAGLPAMNCRMFAAAGSGIYLCGQNAGTGENEVYYFSGDEPIKEMAVEGMKEKAALILFKKIFSTKSPVTCATGNGKTTYIASGKLVIELKMGIDKIETFFVHPSNDITGLAYSENAGLFYSTTGGIGTGFKGGCFDFIKTSNPWIQLRKSNLYVFLPENYGVLKVSNVDELKPGAKNKK